MEPVDYVRILQRRWPLIAATLVLAVVVGWATTPMGSEPQPGVRRSFTATHTLLQEGAVTSGTSSFATPTISLRLLGLLTTTGEIPEQVAQRLNSDEEPAVLASRVTATADGELGALRVTSSGRDGERAALLANTFAEEVKRFVALQAERNRQEAIADTTRVIAGQEDRVRDLQTELDGVDETSADGRLLVAERDAVLAQLQVNQQRLQELEARLAGSTGLYTLEEAVPIPVIEGGFQPPSSRGGRTALAGLLGLLAGLGLALGLEQVDTRVRTRRGAEQAFGLPVVTEVPKLPARQRTGVVLRNHPASYAAEAYRSLRLSLQLMPRWILPPPPPRVVGALDAASAAEVQRPRRVAEGEPAKVILVTSPGAGDGKTTTVVNLAAGFAEVGKVVLALDCDFRHPQLHSYLGIEQANGTSDYLSTAGTPTPLGDLARDTAIDGVWAVPAGTLPSNPGELMGPDQALLAAASELADIVVIDAGPILAVNDPSALLPQVDAVVVVARSGRTTAEAAQRTSELLARLEARVLGVALVGVPRSIIGRRYHDQYLAKPQPPGRDSLAGPRTTTATE